MSKNIFQNELLTRDGEFILPDDFGKYKRFIEMDYYNWFMLKRNPSFLFKADSHYENADSEIIYGILATEFDLPVAYSYPTILVKKNGKYEKGISIQHVVGDSKTEELIEAETIVRSDKYINNSYINQIAKINEKVLEYKEQGKQLIVDKNIPKLIYTMALLDYLTLNTDRHSNNMGYIIKNKGNNKFSITLAKLYDNGCAFSFEDEKDIKKLIKNKKFFTKDEYANEFKFILGEDKEESMTEQVVKKTLSNPDYLKIYKKVKNFDFDVVKQRLSEHYPNYKIPDKKFEYVKKLFNASIKKTKHKTSFRA